MAQLQKELGMTLRCTPDCISDLSVSEAEAEDEAAPKPASEASSVHALEDARPLQAAADEAAPEAAEEEAAPADEAAPKAAVEPRSHEAAASAQPAVRSVAPTAEAVA